jgi:hypothetical protein
VQLAIKPRLVAQGYALRSRSDMRMLHALPSPHPWVHRNQGTGAEEYAPCSCLTRSPADLQDREQHGCGGAGAEEQALQPVNEEEGGAHATGATTGMRSPARVCSQHFEDARCRRDPLQSPP